MTLSFVLILVMVICFLLYKAYKNTFDIKINKITISSESTAKQDQVLSILHLSDLHLENISLTPEQLENKLKNESVDMIALTGDFMDRKRSIPKLLPYLRVLSNVQPKYGTYAVFGNHDYVLKSHDLNKLKLLMEQNDVRVLQNESEIISVNGQTINIIGIDDYSTNRSNLPLAYQHVEQGTNIVLTHDPTVVLEMQDYSFDYLMAGHFHGGQICYPKAYHLVKMGKLARKNVIKGLHKHNDTPFYISEGLGQTGLNIRVGSRPEITFHDVAIRSKSA
ncbi:metallophosphoesterase [Virgibacillus doumboii]|uniref:metallophosphoesterase n=1 Tax=Virgibacillus doumboii TaxID=2697503 RepID=UPI0013DF2870|nr:metallophosphoesterase [Virgibacillus doumboii]